MNHEHPINIRKRKLSASFCKVRNWLEFIAGKLGGIIDYLIKKAPQLRGATTSSG